MKQSLFLFTIGPVQSFIEQARKTQDLYTGSFLLSHLTRIAAKKIEENNGEIIFPNINNQFIPNRFIALINQDNKIATLGNELESLVINEFKRISTNALNDINIGKPQGFEEQIEKLFSINWVVLPLNNSEYQEGYKKIESIMSSIKSVRTFEQLNEKGRKCSICGERNVKFYRKNEHRIEKNNQYLYDRKLFSKDVNITEHSDTSKIYYKHLQPGEGLCGICFTKRIVTKKHLDENYDPNFPSTPRIALLEAYKRLDINTNDIDIDDQAILDYMNNNEPSEYSSKRSKENAKKIYIQIKENNIKVSPYYAILLFDGDNMGKRVSKPNLKEGISYINYHKALTEELGKFAEKATKEIVINPIGKAVYAGGDDFLGFLNLNYLFKTILELRKEFGDIDLSQYTDDTLTFSAGIVIAHIKTPLSEALNWARKMEKEAKNTPDKDAFGIAVLKHSGDIHKSTLKWRSNNRWTTEVLDKIINYLINDQISSKFITNFNREFSRLVDNDGMYIDYSYAFVELKRLLMRSLINKEINSSDIESIVSDLKSLYIYSENSFVNFMSILNIVNFISREVVSYNEN